MNNKIPALIAIGILAVVLMNFVSAPGKNIEIKDKRNEHISVAPGATFCVERTLSSKDNAKAVMAPLFSEGLVLQSIDLKKTVTETYTVNVPDYGTCSRNVETAVNSTGCSSPCSYKNNTCVCTATESYSCVTGSHQETMTREVVSYLPVTDGSYESNKPDKNIKENEVENKRAMLPEKLKSLKQIGHSKGFDLTGNETIRMCFKAPEEDSGITSGTISYLGYNSLDYDYEGSTAVDTYPYKMQIDCSALNNGVPIVINGSKGFSSIHGQNCGKQIVWTYCSGTGTALRYFNCTDYGVWNDTSQLPMEVEQGTGASYQSTSIWKDYGLVWHLSGPSVSDSTGRGHTGTVAGSPNFIPQIIGNSANLSGYTTTAQEISVGDHADYSGLKEVTIEVWLNMTSFGYEASAVNDPSTIIYKEQEYALDTTEGACGGIRKLNFGVFTGTTWYRTCDSIKATSRFGGNRTYFLTGTFNGTTFRLYVNGSLVMELNQAASINDYGTALRVDNHPSGNKYRFPGIYDEVRISNKSMSSARINQIYQNKIGTAGYGTLGSEVVIGSQSSGITAAIKSDSSGNILLNPASGGKVKIAVSITDGVNDITVANAKAAYDHIGQDSIKNVGEWQNQCASCVGANDINANEVQKRVQNTCSAGQAINSISVDGGTGCVSVGSGTATDLSCTSCVSNPEISEMDWSKLQNYPAVCPAGQFINGLGDTLSCASAGSIACSSCDSNFVNVGGDTMTGDLVIGNNLIKNGNNYIQIDDPIFNEMALKSTKSISVLGLDHVDLLATRAICTLKSSDGSFSCSGAKNAEIYVPEINETVYMHAIEGDEVLHVMKGTAQLNKGNLTIILPEKFQYVISENSTPNVQVTPLGKCSLYVSDKKWNAFTVESFAGDTGCKFDWIVFATRRGYDNIGMEKSGTALDTASYCSSQKRIDTQECIDRFDKHNKDKQK